MPCWVQKGPKTQVCSFLEPLSRYLSLHFNVHYSVHCIVHFSLHYLKLSGLFIQDLPASSMLNCIIYFTLIYKLYCSLYFTQFFTVLYIVLYIKVTGRDGIIMVFISASSILVYWYHILYFTVEYCTFNYKYNCTKKS